MELGFVPTRSVDFGACVDGLFWVESGQLQNGQSFFHTELAGSRAERLDGSDGVALPEDVDLESNEVFHKAAFCVWRD